MVKKYKERPVIVEAMQWLGEQSFDALYEFADADNNYGIVGMKDGKGEVAQIRTFLNGIIDVKIGDYITKSNVQVGVSVYSEEQFRAIFEEHEEMYSEAEVFKLICNFNYDLQIDECKDIKDWFEQFKKKYYDAKR